MLRRIAFYLCVLQLAAISPLFAQSRDPVALWFWADKSPATTAGVPNNLAMKGVPFTATYRTYYRLREEGNLSLSVWYRNIMDSQSEHPLADPANDSCSDFGIIAACIADGGSAPDGSVAPGTTMPVTFGGAAAKTVAKGESFWSDAVDFYLPPGHYLAFTWTVQKLTADDAIPHPYENQYSCFTKSGPYASQESSSGFSPTGDFAVAPNAIAYKKPVKKIIGILGNSITQGFNVSMDSYAFWVAQAATDLGPDYGVWNLGSGWARASDAATNKAWLGKAKCCDDAVICLGVNDLRNGATSDQVLGYITTVVNSLLQLSPAKKIILCTVPPFNFTGAAETYWRAVNTAIRANPPAGVSRVFDLAALLGQSPPNDNLANPAYGDGHPNNSGGKFVGKAFADFYLNAGSSGDSVVIDKIVVNGGPYSILWNKTYTGPGQCFAHSICQTADGGFALAGSARDSNGISRALLLTTDNSGELFDWKLLWSGACAAYDCLSAFGGGVAVCGFSTDPAGNENVMAAKYDSTGNLVFEKNLGGVGGNRGYCIAQCADSGFFLTGYTGSFNRGDTDIFALRIGPNGGAAQFVKTFGGAGRDCCRGLACVKGGCFAITGETRTYAVNGGTDVFLAKLDSMGNVAWLKIYGGAGDDVGYNLTATSDGGFAVVGATSSYGTGQKAFLLKTDSLGNYQWSTIAGVAASAAYGVVQTPDSGFMVAANMPSYGLDSAAAVIKTGVRGDSVGIVKFKGFISPGGSPLRDAGPGNLVFCYTSVTGSDTGVGVALMGGVRVMAGGAGYSLVLKSNGALSDWGWNLYGQLGSGTAADCLTAAQTATGVENIASSSYHSLMLRTDHTLWGCGENCYGQLGDGTTLNRYAPVQISPDVQSMAAGHYFSLFLKTDGTLWACGDNSYGQLGDGTTLSRLTPMQIMTGVQSIAAGGYHSLIVKIDGSLWACGLNTYGELGDGTTFNRLTPVQIATGVQSVAAGLYHSLILRTDGTLWSCGDNEYGQLGDATTTNRNAPTLIMTNAQNAVMSVGYYHNLVLKTDGTLWGWGYNGYGQLGDSTTENRPAPVQIMSGVSQMACGSQHSLVLKTDASLWTCGWNYYGQLGDGTTIDRHSPVKISY